MSSDSISIGPIGFRLAHELEGLLCGITADGIITRDEERRIEDWLKANEAYDSVHPFDELVRHLDRVLADGRITLEEAQDLLFVARKYTTVNPHFDALRTGLQILMGILTGIATDRLIDVRETRALMDWLEEWSHLKGLWPYDECCAIVNGILTSSASTEAVAAILGLADQFPVAGEHSPDGGTPPLLIRGICAIDPDVQFRGKKFVFTGESTRGGRAELESLVMQLGGDAEPRVTKRSNYVVACDGGSPYWAFSCYGRKVEQAYNLRREGHAVTILHEVDFWDAVAGQSASL